MPQGGQVSTIVLAAGEGTRMRSATPKVLHRIAGRALVEHAVRAAVGVDPDNRTRQLVRKIGRAHV